MVKKMVKYSKFLLCIALILSLVAPSYAALSASDGSAFVTKAEFDSALADFNARLTTFEAGINSKIDSQVTSYLDRNGIWNGKGLVSHNEYYAWNAIKSGPTWSAGLIGEDAKINWGPGRTSAVYSNYTLETVSNNSSFKAFITPYKVADELPKSGLLIFDLRILSVDTMAMETRTGGDPFRPGVWYWQAAIPDGAQNSICYNFYVGGRLYEVLGSSGIEETKENIVIRLADQAPVNLSSDFRYNLGVIEQLQHYSIFVSKGNELWFEVFLLFQKTFTTNPTLYNTVEDPGYAFQFLNMAIY